MNLPDKFAARYDWLDTQRQCGLDRKREHAQLTMPWLLPLEGRAMGSPLDVPYNTLPAEGINNLSSRIMSVVFPLNGQSVFEMLDHRPFNPDGEDDTELQAAYVRFENKTMDTLAPTNLRAATNLAYQHLIAIGDVLLYEDDEFHFRLYRADQYVVRRKHEGCWQEIIIREAVNAEWHDELKDLPKAESEHSLSPDPRLTEHWEWLYTQILKRPDGGVTVAQEFRGNRLPNEKSYDVSPWMPMRWKALVGEPYGISLVEDMFGDIRALDALSKALLDASLLNAEHRWGVDPTGVNSNLWQDMLDSINGDPITARNGELFPLSFNNTAAVQHTQIAVAHRESVLGRRFLMNSAVQQQLRGQERVPRLQVQLLAQELEQALGGVLSMAGTEVQEPIIRRTLAIMSQKGMIPKDIEEQIRKQGGFIKLRIRAGLEILNREAEREKLAQGIQILASLPEAAQQGAKWNNIGRDFWQAMGLETQGRWKTDEEMAQELAARQQQAQQQMVAEAAVQAAASRAQQGEPEQ